MLYLESRKCVANICSKAKESLPYLKFSIELSSKVRVRWIWSILGDDMPYAGMKVSNTHKN